MSDDQVISRLQAYGASPLDPALASSQLTAIAHEVAPARPWARTVRRIQVAAAFSAGLLLGGAGLAAADVLPDTAQEAAHAALAKVGVNVPPGHDRVTEGCDVDENGEHYKNHGQYVKAHPDDPEAAASDCGKPKRSVDKGGAGDADVEGKGKGNGNGRGEDKAPVQDESSADSKGASDEAPAGEATQDAIPPTEDAPGKDGTAPKGPPTTTGKGELHPSSTTSTTTVATTN